MPSEFTKDPQAELDYTIDWETWLDDDTLSTVTWTVPTGIASELEHNSTTAATIWLSGGTVETRYEVVCHIVTAAAREDDRTIGIFVSQR